MAGEMFRRMEVFGVVGGALGRIDLMRQADSVLCKEQR